MDEELTEDQKTLETFLNPGAAKAEDKAEDKEKEESEEGKPDKPVEAAKGRSFTAGLKARLGSLPTPGSIAFPLLAVLIMIFFVVPVGGKTRAVHLWNVLIGKEALSTETFVATQPTGKQPAAGAGSGEYQDKIIQFQPARFTMIEEGSI